MCANVQISTDKCFSFERIKEDENDQKRRKKIKNK